uniref:Uncharacterized protein n=1 Tax=Geoglobus ahangari TaxID=113653 RepID=A0A7C3YG51_9EURY
MSTLGKEILDKSIKILERLEEKGCLGYGLTVEKVQDRINMENVWQEGELIMFKIERHPDIIPFSKDLYGLILKEVREVTYSVDPKSDCESSIKEVSSRLVDIYYDPDSWCNYFLGLYFDLYFGEYRKIVDLTCDEREDIMAKAEELLDEELVERYKDEIDVQKLISIKRDLLETLSKKLFQTLKEEDNDLLS